MEIIFELSIPSLKYFLFSNTLKIYLRILKDCKNQPT